MPTNTPPNYHGASHASFGLQFHYVYTQELTQHKWIASLVHLWPQHLATILIIVKSSSTTMLIFMIMLCKITATVMTYEMVSLSQVLQGPLTMANLEWRTPNALSTFFWIFSHCAPECMQNNRPRSSSCHYVSMNYMSSMDWSTTPLLPSLVFLLLCNQAQDKSITIGLIIFLEELVYRTIYNGHRTYEKNTISYNWYQGRVSSRVTYLVVVGCQ